MKKLTVAFDVDGVLRNLVQYTLDNNVVLDALKPENRKRPNEITSYGDFVKLFESKEQWKKLLNESGAWKNSPHHRSMIDLFRVLKTKGYNCIIVTSNSHLIGQMETVEWLHKHIDSEVAAYKEGLDIHFVNDKLTVKYDAIIEDMPVNAWKASEDGRLGFLVKRPWSNLETQKADSRNKIVSKWDKRLLIQLPEDIEAFQIVFDKLAWYEGFMEGMRDAVGRRLHLRPD